MKTVMMNQAIKYPAHELEPRKNPQDNSQPHPLFEPIEKFASACQIVEIKVVLLILSDSIEMMIQEFDQQCFIL